MISASGTQSAPNDERERATEAHRVRVPVVRVFRDRFHDDGVELGGDGSRGVVRRGERLSDTCALSTETIPLTSSKGPRPDKQRVKDDSHGVDVRSFVDAPSARLLG